MTNTTALHAERAVIAALLKNNLLYEHVADFLQDQHFYDPLHKKIYAAIVLFIAKGQLANNITLWPFFENDPAINEKGGEEYLKVLVSATLSVTHIGDYAKQVFDAYLRRELINIGQEIIQDAAEMKINHLAIDIISDAENKLFKISTMHVSGKSVQSFNSVLKSAVQQAQIAYKKDSHVIGIETGFIDLDKHLGGLHKSDLIILAARPSMGKTALATNIAFQAAKARLKNLQTGAKVAFFSLEMSAEQLALRILGQESQIPSDCIRRGIMSSADFDKLTLKSQELAEVPLFIDDSPALTIAGLRTRARRLQRQEKIDLIIVDYLQLLVGGERSENRVQELSFITRSLKALAKELHIPIVALSQLSRAVEQREEKRPQLADLRESGTIEQDADVVMFIYREAYYEARKKPTEGSPKMQAWQAKMEKIYNIAEIMIAKQRHGPIRNINLFFQEAYTRFTNISM